MELSILLRLTNDEPILSRSIIPSYQTAQSAGMDLHANIKDPISFSPLERHLIPTGISISLPMYVEAQVRPRSGLALKKGLTVLNSPGTIDPDYRGEIGVILVNLSNDYVLVEPGERIAQLVFSPFIRNVKWKLVEVLDSTDRGTGGFGSTGTLMPAV